MNSASCHRPTQLSATGQSSHRPVCWRPELSRAQHHRITSPAAGAIASAPGRALKHTERVRVVAHGKAIKVDGKQLELEITKREQTLIVDFYATWCGPCLLLAKELETVGEQLGNTVRILKVDVDANQELSSQLGIEALPTMVVIPKGGDKQPVRTEGLLPAKKIIEMVKELQK